MKKNKVDFTQFNNDWYDPKRGLFVRILWYLINIIFFQSYLFPFYKFKIFLLKIFGAKIGTNLIIKPSVNIKYPWNLKIGNNVWIGENVWIDNLCEIFIGNNVCISQGAMLLTGNHNYKLVTFDLMVKSIRLEDGVWIGAKSIVCPNVVCQTHSVLSVGSVATKTLDPYSIYQGIPAIIVNKRIIV
jgi:putative colanic acid biosynthesis acetyltransferase WcaF